MTRKEMPQLSKYKSKQRNGTFKQKQDLDTYNPSTYFSDSLLTAFVAKSPTPVALGCLVHCATSPVEKQAVPRCDRIVSPSTCSSKNTDSCLTRNKIWNTTYTFVTPRLPRHNTGLVVCTSTSTKTLAYCVRKGICVCHA
jgi:hypothetical protein